MLKNLEALVVLLEWSHGVMSVLWHHVGPQCRFRCPVSKHLIRDRREVMYQTKISRRQGAPLWLRIHSELGKGKLSRLSPDLDGGLDVGRPEQIGLLRRLRRLWHHGGRAVHIVATDLMLGTVTAG
jgi:hypothetical protein